MDPSDARAGESAQVIVTAKMQPGWRIYRLRQEGGPVATSFTVPSGQPFRANGDPVQPDYSVKFDKGFGTEVGTFGGEVSFGVPISISEGASGTVKGKIQVLWQACDPTGCANPETTDVPFQFTIQSGTARPDRMAAVTAIPEQPPGYEEPRNEIAEQAQEPGAARDEFAEKVKKAESAGLLSYIVFAFLMGLLALATPCVFPMVPVTVSYFSKRSGVEAAAPLRDALAYCAGIISTFTALGLIVTLAFGATGVQKLSTDPFVNMALALLFIFLALSLFGVIHLRLPQRWVSKAQSGTKLGGITGSLLMGLTFSLTSFTCTVPFVGTLLAGAAHGGGVTFPIFGMMAFSTALAIPFFMLAMFPTWLNKLPRSGAWMSVVKSYMGFLELAFALKFLSNVDLVYQWGLFPKPIFLAIWAIIFVIAGLYLLGWLRLPNDAMGRAGWIRRGFGVATLGAGIYCLAAIGTLQLPKQIAAFLPPDPYPGRAASPTAVLKWTEDLEAAKRTAKAEDKLLLLNFTGVT